MAEGVEGGGTPPVTVGEFADVVRGTAAADVLSRTAAALRDPASAVSGWVAAIEAMGKSLPSAGSPPRAIPPLADDGTTVPDLRDVLHLVAARHHRGELAADEVDHILAAGLPDASQREAAASRMMAVVRGLRPAVPDGPVGAPAR